MVLRAGRSLPRAPLGMFEPRRCRRDARGDHRSRRCAPAQAPLRQAAPRPPSKLQPALRRDRGRRQDRRGAAPGGPDGPRHPGLADQDHDALSAVRAARSRQDHARHADAGVRGGREPGADQARASSPATRSRSRTRSRASSPSRPTTPPWSSPKRSAAAKTNSRAMMTRKASALGMRNTVYRNASGLPNDEQITTARDQALLGIAIQQRFPKYYRYFSLASFVYRGKRHPQPQPAARQGGRRRRHQDRLHPRLGLQSRHLGQARLSPHRRGGAGRPLRRQPRRADARTDQRATSPTHRPSRRLHAGGGSAEPMPPSLPALFAPLEAGSRG